MKTKNFISGKSYVEVSGAIITEEDKKILHSAVDAEWYTEWHYCKLFEDVLKGITGKKHIQLVNSGSSASLIAMNSALRKFDPGHEKPYVLTCATAFPTTVSPIYQMGRIPIYVNIIPETLEPNYHQMANIYADNYKEIAGMIFTHTMGFPFKEEKVKSFIQKDGFLIADCCDALGSQFENEGLIPVGYYSDLSTYSFFPAHHITCGEGGAVATNDPELAEYARCYSNWGRSCYCQPGQSNTCGKRFEYEDRGQLPEGWDHKYIFSELGYNLKMTEFQAALGYSQSLRLTNVVFNRYLNYVTLYDGLSKFSSLHLINFPNNAKISPFGFPILVNEDAPFTARELIAYLEKHKIHTRRLFGGNITKQPAFMNMPCVKPFPLEGSDRVMNDMFWIGCHPGITQEMLDYVLEVFNDFMRKYE